MLDSGEKFLVIVGEEARVWESYLTKDMVSEENFVEKIVPEGWIAGCFHKRSYEKSKRPGLDMEEPKTPCMTLSIQHKFIGLLEAVLVEPGFNLAADVVNILGPQIDRATLKPYL